MLAGAAAVCLAAAPSLASAASLKGKPFLLDPDFDGVQQYSTVFAYGGGFGATLTANTIDGTLPSELSFKTFTKAGKVDIKKTFVAKGGKGESGLVIIEGAGGLDLGDKTPFVGYLDHGLTQKKKAVGGLFAQKFDGKKPKGKELTLDNAKKNEVDVAGIVRLGDGRGIAYWRVANDSTGAVTASGRLISLKGKPDKDVVKLGRKDGYLSGVAASGEGFIVLNETLTDFTNLSVFAQAYDQNGAKSGDEAALLENVDQSVNQNVKILGLSGQRSVLLKSAPASNGRPTVVGQVYDSAWRKVGGESVLMTGLSSARYAATALPWGDFLIAAVTGEDLGVENGRIEFRRFGQNLRQVGSAAKTKPEKPEINVTQLLALKGGDAVIVYAGANRKLKAQLVKP